MIECSQSELTALSKPPPEVAENCMQQCVRVWEGWGIKAEPGRQKSSLSHIVSEITNIAALDNSKLRRWSGYRRYFLPLTLCSGVILNHSWPIHLFLCFLQFFLLWSTPPTSTVISIQFNARSPFLLPPPFLSFPLCLFSLLPFSLFRYQF